MESAEGWTGKSACRLQAAMHLSNEAFAAHLGIAVRTVAAWHQKPTLRPQSAMQQILDTALEQASSAVKARFAPNPAERRLDADPNISAALSWLDHHSKWEPGTARREVASRLSHLNPSHLRDRAARRARIDRHRIAETLNAYYRDRPPGYGQYATASALTSILTHRDWLDLACSLMPPSDTATLATTAADVSLDADAADRAAQRLAETLALDVRLQDAPLYRLSQVHPRRGAITTSFQVTRFVHYGLTMDLLEGELVDAIAAGHADLPLRDRYLPDTAAVLNIANRLCAGGALALTAIARPADPLRGPADYVLLIQERSGQVVNAARKLAVIPKGFHGPLTDFRADAHLGPTLRRELEEELFGREDIDSTVGQSKRADPMHPTHLSDPMRWLLAEPGRLHLECTAFGLNLVSGNYEFAGLVLIEDDEFWTRFGGLIEANWEATSLRQYSSLDTAGLAELINDAAWSNEGLFALLQGLRRLSEIGGPRVAAPAVEWEIR